MRVAKVGDRPQRLLENVRGMELVPLPQSEQCCGFGGTFSLKNPDISVAMAADKARHVADTGAEYLITGDNLCLLNISGMLERQQAGIKPIHLAQVLAHTEPVHEAGGGAGAAQTVLNALATSLITVTSLTFSLTVLTLQLASSQYSPRLLRTFAADRFVQRTLALFRCTQSVLWPR